MRSCCRLKSFLRELSGHVGTSHKLILRNHGLHELEGAALLDSLHLLQLLTWVMDLHDLLADSLVLLLWHLHDASHGRYGLQHSGLLSCRMHNILELRRLLGRSSH